MADFDLQGLLASFDPTEEQKHAAKMAALTQLGLGLLGTHKGEELQRLGYAGTNAMAGYGHALNDIPRQKMERMAAAGQAMGLQEKMRQFSDDDRARQILMGGAPQSMAPPQFGMGDRSSGMMPPAGPPPMSPPPSGAAPKGLYEQLLAKADALEQGGLPQKAQEYRMLAEKYAPKYKSLETVQGPDGKPRLLQTFENQAPNETQYQPKPDFKQVDSGGGIGFIDPWTRQEGPVMVKSATPGELMSNDIARGNLAVSQAHLGLARNADARAAAGEQAGQVIPTPDGLFLVDKRGGTGKAITGPDGKPLMQNEKPLTESQANAAGFGMRARAAADIFGKLESQGHPLGSPKAKLAESGVTNMFAPEWAQQAQQAKLNFMTANLRKESGATISATEFETEDKKYFPQFGDGPKVREQKRQMRELAIRSLAVQAGKQGAAQINAKPGWSIEKVQ